MIDKKLAAQIRQWRRHLHMHPEISFREFETSHFVAETLGDIPNMQVQMQVGYETAVVGTLSSGSGPVIAIRADMDALPIQEKNTHGFRSRNDGVMHACGHDAHTAIALGVATKISAYFSENKWQGTVKFIFQPAEETADAHPSTGAPYIVESGVLDNVDIVLALHMSPENMVGEVKIHDGYSMANVDIFHAEIAGTGGHGAYPHLGTDPIWMMGQILQAIYAIPSRHISPLSPAVISVGKISGGSASNIIPSCAEINGTIRSYDPLTRKQLQQEMQHVFAMAESMGFSHRLQIDAEDPALWNDPGVNELLREVVRDVYPEFDIIDEPFGMGGEDFAHMTKKCRGAMFFLGCSLNDGENRDLHTPYFDIDERALTIGAEIMTNAIMCFFWKWGKYDDYTA